MLEQFAKTLEYLEGHWFERRPNVLQFPTGMQDCCGDEDSGTFTATQGIALEQITEDAEVLTPREAKLRIGRNIPNERNIQVIEVCPGNGTGFGYGFAVQHPAVQVDLVGKTESSELGSWMFLEELRKRFQHQDPPHADKKLQEMLERTGTTPYPISAGLRGDPRSVLTNVFIANDRGNMRYHERDLLDKGALGGIVDPLKETYVIGFRCPGPVGTVALVHAVAEEVQGIALTNSALPTTDARIHFPLSAAAKQFEKRYRRAMATLHDPACEDSTDRSRFRLDYQKPEQQRHGFALKHLRALDMLMYLREHRYQARMITIPPQQNTTVNAAEHLIYGFKGRDILS